MDKEAKECKKCQCTLVFTENNGKWVKYCPKCDFQVEVTDQEMVRLTGRF